MQYSLNFFYHVFDPFIIIASKFIFINLLNSRVLLNPVVSTISFWISAAFVLRLSFEVVLVRSSIVFSSNIFLTFVLLAALVARLPKNLAFCFKPLQHLQKQFYLKKH